MKRLKCIVAYDGTDYSGFQFQPGQKTIQGALENAIGFMQKGTKSPITSSGRTDTGVHARGQVFHFDPVFPQIPVEGWKKGLNAHLPPDIRILDVQATHPSFHARFDALKKEYRYRVLASCDPDVFRRRFVYFHPQPLDLLRMQQAARAFVGKHDFSAFCASGATVRTKVRTVYKADVRKNGDEIVFCFVGSGFLYHMVRIMVGTLLEVGRGERDPQDTAKIIASRDRTMAGATAPPEGLVLWRVDYPEKDRETSSFS